MVQKLRFRILLGSPTDSSAVPRYIDLAGQGLHGPLVASLIDAIPAGGGPVISWYPGYQHGLKNRSWISNNGYYTCDITRTWNSILWYIVHVMLPWIPWIWIWKPKHNGSCSCQIWIFQPSFCETKSTTKLWTLRGLVTRNYIPAEATYSHTVYTATSYIYIYMYIHIYI